MATTTKTATYNTIVDSATIQNFLKAKVTLSYTKSVTGRKLWRSFDGYKYERLNKSQVAQYLAKFGLTIDTYLAAQKQWCDAQVAKACTAIDTESNDIVDDYIVTPSAGLVALSAEPDAAYNAERAAQEAINARINEARKLFKELAANSPIVVNSFTDAWNVLSNFVVYAPFEFSYESHAGSIRDENRNRIGLTTRFFFCPEFDNPFFFAENFTEDGSFYSVEIKYGFAGNKPITIQIQPVDTQQVAIDAEEHSAKAQGNTSTTPAFKTGNVYLLNTSSMSAIPIMRKFKCLNRSNAYVSITQYLEDKQIYSPYPERYKIRNGSDGEFIKVSIIEHLYPRTLFAKDLVERDTATPLTDNQKQAAEIVKLLGNRIVKFAHAGDGHNGGLALHYVTFNDEHDEFGTDLAIVEVFTDQTSFILDHVNLIKGFGDNKTVTQFFFDKPVTTTALVPASFYARNNFTIDERCVINGKPVTIAEYVRFCEDIIKSRTPWRSDAWHKRLEEDDPVEHDAWLDEFCEIDASIQECITEIAQLTGVTLHDDESYLDDYKTFTTKPTIDDEPIQPPTTSPQAEELRLHIGLAKAAINHIEDNFLCSTACSMDEYDAQQITKLKAEIARDEAKLAELETTEPAVDNEPIQPPVTEQPADDFNAQLDKLKADRDLAKTIFAEKESAWKQAGLEAQKACDAYENAKDAITRFYAEKALGLTAAIGNLPDMKLHTQDGRDLFGGNTTEVIAHYDDNFTDCFAITIEGEFFYGYCGYYYTPEQVTTVINQLKDAVKRGATEFAFPTVEQLKSPTGKPNKLTDDPDSGGETTDDLKDRTFITPDDTVLTFDEPIIIQALGNGMLINGQLVASYDSERDAKCATYLLRNEVAKLGGV